MSTEHNPFAALLAGLPRYELNCHSVELETEPNGNWLSRDDVLAALAAAVPADLAEAGKVLEGVTGTSWVYRPGHYDDWGIVKDGDCVICQARHPDRISSEVLSEWRAKGQDPWEANARFIAWCREGVPALLARIAAQEAQIKGLAADRDNLSAKLEIERLLTDGIHRRAEAAETALAASEARVAKLVEALDAFPADWRERAHSFKGVLKLQAAWADGFNAARAAITEAGQ